MKINLTAVGLRMPTGIVDRLSASPMPRRSESERPAARPGADARCPKHPSIPASYCACGSHKPVVRSLYSKPPAPRPNTKIVPDLKRDRTTGYQAEATISTTLGILTICGVCGLIAADHRTYKTAKERLATLLTFIRTNECKHCRGGFVQHGECGSLDSPDGECHRRYLPRSKKVSSCYDCAHAESTDRKGNKLYGVHIVKADEFKTMPRVWVEVWRKALQERGLL